MPLLSSLLDRPYERLKDVEDLTRIFEYALDDDDERRWAPSIL